MNTADSKYRSLNKSISIVMPAYNEEQNIEKTVKKCAHLLDSLAVKGEVVVTDDGSVDRTKEILNGLKGKMANLVVVEHKENKGYGASLNDAIIASKGDLIVSIDSDGQFDIDELPLLLDRYMEGHPIVAGFRKEKKDSFFKVFADRCMNLMVNMMFGLRLRDSNCAFKLYERDIIKPVKVESMGFSAPTEIMVKLKTNGHSFAEVGITHSAREKGKSALKLVGTSLNFFTFLFYLKLKQGLYRKRVINNF